MYIRSISDFSISLGPSGSGSLVCLQQAQVYELVTTIGDIRHGIGLQPKLCWPLHEEIS
jgi:hypothetical protein